MSTDVSEVRGASIIREIALMMEQARTSETSLEIQLRTRQYISEDKELQIARMFIAVFTKAHRRAICRVTII
jgi:hypothetical protein